MGLGRFFLSRGGGLEEGLRLGGSGGQAGELGFFGGEGGLQELEGRGVHDQGLLAGGRHGLDEVVVGVDVGTDAAVLEHVVELCHGFGLGLGGDGRVTHVRALGRGQGTHLGEGGHALGSPEVVAALGLQLGGELVVEIHEGLLSLAFVEGVATSEGLLGLVGGLLGVVFLLGFDPVGSLVGVFLGQHLFELGLTFGLFFSDLGFGSCSERFFLKGGQMFCLFSA